jgi:hypothetical protein
MILGRRKAPNKIVQAFSFLAVHQGEPFCCVPLTAFTGAIFPSTPEDGCAGWFVK